MYALHAAAVGLGLGLDDEVLVPAHTYMATATSVLSVGAIPVIVDIDESLTIDPNAIEDAIGPATRAVIPVHLWGGACDMDAIRKIAKKHDLLVLEDACTGIGGAHESRMLGTIGDAGAYSFNYYKIITAGEGGGGVTNDPEIDKRVACSIDPCHHYWTGREHDMMPFADNGGRASEILGAVLNVQLGRLSGMVEAMRAQRRQIVEGIRHLDNLGLRMAPLHSPEHDVAAHVIYNLPSAEAAATFATVCPSVIAGKTGRHTYVDWDQVLMGEGAGHPAMNPYNVRGLVRWVSGMDTERFNPGALFQSVTVGKLGVMQAQFVWFLGLALLAWYILRRTKLGNHIYASGGNKAAAIATGVNVDRVKLICFMLASTAATIAGVLSLTRVHSVTPAQGLGVELKVIAMCVIGGLALMGGRGTIIGIFIGACLFYTVEDVLLLIRAPGHLLDLFIGCVIVVAVIMNTWAARREDRW